MVCLAMMGSVLLRRLLKRRRLLLHMVMVVVLRGGQELLGVMVCRLRELLRSEPLESRSRMVMGRSCLMMGRMMMLSLSDGWHGSPGDQ